MKNNKPIVIGIVLITLLGGTFVATGGYEYFIMPDHISVDYPDLPDYGYDDGFEYNTITDDESQETLAKEYYRDNPETDINPEDFTVRYDRVKATNSSNEIFNYGLQGNALYPGAMVLATPTEVGASISIPSIERGGGVFSINQEGVQTSGSLVAKVDKVNQSEVRTAINSIITDKDLSKFTTVIDYQYRTIKSAVEYDLLVGANVDICSRFNIEDTFNSNSSLITTKAVMIVKQICFEVSMNHPESFVDFFDKTQVTTSKIEKAFGTDATPLYVSSVAYGRTLIITAESTLDESSLG